MKTPVLGCLLSPTPPSAEVPPPVGKVRLEPGGRLSEERGANAPEEDGEGDFLPISLLHLSKLGAEVSPEGNRGLARAACALGQHPSTGVGVRNQRFLSGLRNPEGSGAPPPRLPVSRQSDTRLRPGSRHPASCSLLTTPPPGGPRRLQKGTPGGSPQRRKAKPQRPRREGERRLCPPSAYRPSGSTGSRCTACGEPPTSAEATPAAPSVCGRFGPLVSSRRAAGARAPGPPLRLAG